jgi:hypothetical protein
MAIPTAVALAGAGGGGGGNNIPPQGPYAYASQGRGGALVPSPGGALVAPSAQNLAYPTMVGAGQASQSNPGLFQNLLNMLGGVPGLKYAPGIAVTAGQVAQGDIGGAIGAGVGTAVGAKLAGSAVAPVLQSLGAAFPAAGLPGLAVKAGLYGVGTLLGSSLGAQLGKGVGAVGNQLIGGTQAAVGDAANALAGTQREAGKGAFTGSEPGVASDKALAQRQQLLYQMGVSNPLQYLQQGYQIQQKYKDADVSRQMQLNQQNAQLTGQLNQQIMAGQLAAGAQQGSYRLTEGILANNPYRDSVLQTGGVRGI